MRRAVIALTLLGATAPNDVLADGVPAPSSGKSQIVIFRTGGYKGGPISCAVRENGEKLTSLPPHHYVVIPLEPGQHTLAVKSEKTETLSHDYAPDKTYYAECTIDSGIIVSRPHLRGSSREAFMAELPKLKPFAE